MTDRKQIGDWAGTPTAMSSRRCHHSATAARSKQIWAARLRERSEILRNRQEAGETVSQSKSVAWRGGRSGETKSTTKPSGQERPLGFVHFNAVSSSQLFDRRRSDAKHKAHFAVKVCSLRKLCVVVCRRSYCLDRCCRCDSMCQSLLPIWSDKPRGVGHAVRAQAVWRNRHADDRLVRVDVKLSRMPLRPALVSAGLRSTRRGPVR